MPGRNDDRIVIPFNEFRKEQRQKLKPLVLPIGDDEYEFSGDMPAGVTMIFMAKMREHGEDFDLDDLSYMEVIEVFEAIMSPDKLNAMIQKHDLGTDDLFWIYGYLMTHWTEQMPEAHEGNAPERLEQLSTSSKTGRSSKRTSKAATA